MTFPDLTIFFRSISRPIMNRRKMRPSSAMTSIEACDLTSFRPEGPITKPPTR